MGPQLNLNDIGRNYLLGNRKKIAKFLMRTFTCRSTFLYACPLAPIKGEISLTLTLTPGLLLYCRGEQEQGLIPEKLLSPLCVSQS
jgi:hypothetical protein